MLTSRLARAVTLPRAAVAAVVVAAAVVTAVAAPVGAKPSGTPVCSATNLRLDKFGPGQGFTSHRQWDFALRNVSSQTCHLRGYPGVTLLNVSAASTGVSAAHHTTVPVTTVTLGPWKRAFFSFVYVTSGPCVPHFFTAYGLRVTPPGTHGHLGYYAGRFQVCSVSVGGRPTVTAVASHL
jgi:hypothetical protein